MMKQRLPTGTAPSLAPTPSPYAEADCANTDLQESLEAAQTYRDACTGWLQRRGIDPEELPHYTMENREYNLFRNVGVGTENPAPNIYHTREEYEIPSGQTFVWIEAPDGTDPKLVNVTELDFGTKVELAGVALDFDVPHSEPNDPDAPEMLGGALKTVDIAETITEASFSLKGFAKRLMKGKYTDPFKNATGDVGVRAGGIMPGQPDAFIWTTSEFVKSLELAIAFPTQYDSVCIVAGKKKEALNGKPGMAQLEEPEVVLEIKDEMLDELKIIYTELYHQPFFALTPQQSIQRDAVFNGLRGLISNAAAQRKASVARSTGHNALKALSLPR
ncbi:MAG: hypothetical protein WAQ24_05635 [Candidatus Saccharimonadales bacterium]